MSLEIKNIKSIEEENTQNKVRIVKLLNQRMS